MADHPLKPAQPEVQPPNRWLPAGVCLFLALAVWTVFGQTLHHGFVYDDVLYVTENYHVQQGLTWPGVVWAFRHSVAANWHPLTVLSHMLDCQLYGLNPAGHHLISVLLHAATAILLFLVLRGMTGSLWPAAFVAAVFAIHPLRVESVAWVAERKDVLSGLFFMLTLGAYFRYVRQSEARGVKAKAWYALALLLFALGLMAKPMLVTLPFVLLLLDYWPLRRLKPAATATEPEDVRNLRSAWLRLFLEKVPFLLLSAADCAATMLAQRYAINPTRDLPFAWRIGNALVAYAVYIRQMLYPVGLAVLYPHPENRLSAWSIGWSALVLLVISGGVLAGRRKHPYLLVGWLWYLGMLLPVIGLVQVGSQARADRYTYLPQIGLYVMAAWGAAELCRSWRCRRAVLGLGATAIIAGLLAGAYFQTGYWKDGVALWTRALDCTSGNAYARVNLGVALAACGKLEEAVDQYEQALQLKPDNAEARLDLGSALEMQGRFAEAIRQYKWALQLKPDFADARGNLGGALKKQGKLDEAVRQLVIAIQLNPENVDAHNNLGAALAAQGKPDAAIREYELALQLKPDYADARNNLGNALEIEGMFDPAVQQFERAIQIKPDFAEAHMNLGVVLARQGKFNDAARHFEQALQFKPDYPDAHYNFGIALASQGRITEAIGHYERALQLKPDLAAVHNNLGSALETQGNLDDAIHHFELALQLKPDFAEAQVNLGLALAKQGKLEEAKQQLQQALKLATARNNPALANAIRDQIKSLRGPPAQ